jgi:hypothetical protein
MFDKPFILTDKKYCWGVPLDRSAAIVFLKALLSQCNDFSPESVSFESSINNNSIGLQVHIRGTFFESDKHRVREVAKKQNLSVQEDLDGFVIYNDKG